MTVLTNKEARYCAFEDKVMIPFSTYLSTKWGTDRIPRLSSHLEVTCDHPESNSHGLFPDHIYRFWVLVPDGSFLIRGDFRMGMVWSEVASGWEWYDQRSLPDGNCMIRWAFSLANTLVLAFAWVILASLKTRAGALLCSIRSAPELAAKEKSKAPS